MRSCTLPIFRTL
ncbi:hypothetical protein VTL71DRAFT_15189 [Oculimacula yallundae]|uniref:Uncharacterized protein n=1 Tax=Oculimacula yallundae TaxID=86028 RepID=A0ABR4CHY3_9HELO